MLQNLSRAEDDQELAIFIEQGNQQTFGAVYDKYAYGLLEIIGRIVNDNTIAEEVLNNTFVNAWNQIVNLNSSNSSLFIWLIKLARQMAFDKVKNEEDQNYITPQSYMMKKKRGLQIEFPLPGKNNYQLLIWFIIKGGLLMKPQKSAINLMVN